jgi:drug/metabolite transporter (DMT)-like permease
MLGLIALDSVLYSSRLAIRKNYIFKHITPITYMIGGALSTLFFVLIWYFFDPKHVINLDDIKGLKKMGIYFLLLQLVGFFNYLIFLYLIDKNEISYLVPLNEIFVILFSSIIGILFLKETITLFKLVGIFLGCIGICLINH